jgi:hypothetical protein
MKYQEIFNEKMGIFLLLKFFLYRKQQQQQQTKTKTHTKKQHILDRANR